MERNARRVVWGSALLIAATTFTLAELRYATFHNQTFDLAFYTRIAWGLSRGVFYEPIVGAHVLGLHLSFVLVPLGLLGRALGAGATPHVLLFAQSVAVGAATFPLARVGERAFGGRGAVVAGIAWALYPNLGHVVAYEFHPGTVSVLPLAWAIERLDAKDARGFGIACLGALSCREDLGLVLFVLALLAVRAPALRKVGAGVLAVSVLWVVVFAAWIHPAYAPPNGSLALHFGPWGKSSAEVAAYVLSHPGDVVTHLVEGARLSYLPRILLPLALLPFVRPMRALPALPVIAINLLSFFPTTTRIDSHYLTPAIPFLVVAAIDGWKAISARFGARCGVIALAASSVIGHVGFGGTPLSMDFEGGDFRQDERTTSARAIVDAIPADAGVQAPDFLLPHVAERRRVYRGPPPVRDVEYVVFDASHRQWFSGSEDLLRTEEEPFLRWWLSRDDYGLALTHGTLALSKRGLSPRDGVGGRAISGRSASHVGTPITGCLSIVRAELGAEVLVLDLYVNGVCPEDLAIRLGGGGEGTRVDLLFGGWLSPAQLRAGDLLRSVHPIAPAERAQMRARKGVAIGAIRSSGARPDPEDPRFVFVGF